MMTPQKLQWSVQALHQMLNLGHVIHMRFLRLSFKKILLHFTKEEKRICMARVFGECESQTVGVRGHSKGVNSAHKHSEL